MRLANIEIQNEKDRYYAANLIKHSVLKTMKIPLDLVDAKVSHLKLTRKIKELK